MQLSGPLIRRRVVHRLDFKLGLGAGLFQVLLGKMRRILALAGLHRLVLLALRSALLFLLVNIFLDAQPALNNRFGVRLEMFLGFFHALLA